MMDRSGDIYSFVHRHDVSLWGSNKNQLNYIVNSVVASQGATQNHLSSQANRINIEDDASNVYHVSVSAPG
jgi:hypothetical protein